MKERPILFSTPISPEPNTGCWLWTGAVNAKGYGRFQNRMAHRVALESVGRIIPAGFEVDHRCRVRCCVNPDHLDVVTHAENIRRKLYPATCPAGHNRWSTRRGKRACLECGRIRNAEIYRSSHAPVRRGRRWLDWAERLTIRALVRAGWSHSEIAPLMRTTISTVSRVRNSDA